MNCLTVITFGLICLVHFGNAQRRLPRPSGIKVPQRTPHTVTLSWAKPRGRIKYASYMVLVNPRSAIVHPPTRDDQTWRSIRRLLPGMRYRVTIVGITSDGRESPPNNYDLYSEPLPPKDLSLEAATDVEVTLSLGSLETSYSINTVAIKADWTPSSSDRNGMSSYDVQISPNEGIATYWDYPKDQEDTSRVIGGLTPGEEYTVSVRSHVGPPYNLVYSSPLTKSIRLPPAEPYAATETSVGSTRATIQTIGPLTGIYSSLDLVLEPDHGQISTPIPYPGRETHDLYTLTGLMPNTEYTLSVYSVAWGVRSRTAVLVHFRTAGIPPVKLEVTDYGHDSVTLQFDQPDVETDEVVLYTISYSDVLGISPDGVRSEIVAVRPGNTTVHIKISDLDSGVTYSFMVFGEINGETSPVLAEAVQTTVPPEPELAFLDRTEDGIVARVEKPYYGQCPHVIVTYSPPLPNETFVEPRIVSVNENFTIPGLPREERYTIHLRCVSNNVEGPSYDVSSTSTIGLPDVDGPNQEPNRIPLVCARPKNSGEPTKPKDPEGVIRDACCGDRPYSTTTHSCCGSSPISRSDDSLCCIERSYNRTIEKCCAGGTVMTSSEECN